VRRDTLAVLTDDAPSDSLAVHGSEDRSGGEPHPEGPTRLEVVEVDPDEVAAALDEMRGARRHRRIGDVAWGDLAYRVYTTTLACLVFAVFASGWVGDHEVSAAAQHTVRDLGPAWAGLAAAVALLIGVRSGTRGGPLALEAADVFHLLLAPIDRSRVLRRPASGVIGYGIAGGIAVGGLTGALCSQRLPGSNLEWMLCGALFGGATAALALGAALVAAARRVPAPVLLVGAWLLSLWQLGAVTEVVPFAPLTLLGKILFWPMRLEPVDLVWVVLALALTALGLRLIGGLSIELAQRRTRLVGQLRFAVTQQDLRSVLLLRRQLAAERPRNRSRLRRVPISFGARFPVLTRDLQSAARWPWVRVLRVVVLGVAAGLALRGVWSGTTPLILVAGACTYIAALDTIEPLAQEIDHPTTLASYPVPAGVVLQKHLVAPVLLMLVAGAAGVVAAWAIDPSVQALTIGAVTLVSAAGAAVAGASISVVSEATLDQSDAAMMPPEVAGPRVVLRTLWPPLVAIIGVTPVLLAQRAMRLGDDPLPPAAMVAVPVLVLVGVVFLWVRHREDLHSAMREAMGGTR
jgi:hypothetical protein